VPNLALAHHGPPATFPLCFTLDDDEFTLPLLDSRVWLEALVYERPWSWLRIVPQLLAGDGSRRLTRRLGDPDDAFDLDDLEAVAEQVLTHACGVDFHTAARLAGGAYSNWMVFDGWCATTSGLDPLGLPIGRLLAAVYAWRRSMCVEKGDFARLDAELWQPAPHLTVSGNRRDAVPPTWTDELEESSFLAAMAALGRRGRGG